MAITRRSFGLTQPYSRGHRRQALAVTVTCIVTIMCMTTCAHSSDALLQAKDYLVRDLDKVVPDFALFDGDMFAGLLSTDNGNRTGELMFWLFAPHHPIVDDSLVIWLNGGPGCSSFMAGVMFETGPVTVPLLPAGACCVYRYASLQYNEYAWTNTTAMLYVEMPVGVGFSSGNAAPRDEAEVPADFFVFLQHFYAVFESFRETRLFIVGESYAGMFVPSIAHKIYTEMQQQQLKARHDRMIHIHLAGIGLGNGWVDASVQGPATIDYAYWHGMIDQYTRENLHATWNRCMRGEMSYDEKQPFHAFTTPDDCGMMTGALMAAGQGAWSDRPSVPNTYDVTTWDPYAVFHGESSLLDFFNDGRVQEALHAHPGTGWSGCLPGAGRRRRMQSRRRRNLGMLDHDEPQSTLPYIAELLDANIRVIAYNGDRDLSTCAQGTEMLLNSMNWSGHDDWLSTRRGLWTVGKEQAGYAKSLEGLDFVVVYNSGHLVPYNQPAHALDLITRFLKNESFSDQPLPSFDQHRGSGRLDNDLPSTVTAGVTWSCGALGVAMLALFFAFAAGYGAASLSRRKPGYAPI